MRPIDFEQTNITYTKPEAMTDEDCAPLHAWKGKTTSGDVCTLTAWMPNKEDLEAINRGEPIWLQIMGPGFPPLAMFTETPWEEPKPREQDI